jgi:hypothetical protein
LANYTSPPKKKRTGKKRKKNENEKKGKERCEYVARKEIWRLEVKKKGSPFHFMLLLLLFRSVAAP